MREGKEESGRRGAIRKKNIIRAPTTLSRQKEKRNILYVDHKIVGVVYSYSLICYHLLFKFIECAIDLQIVKKQLASTVYPAVAVCVYGHCLARARACAVSAP